MEEYNWCRLSFIQGLWLFSILHYTPDSPIHLSVCQKPPRICKWCVTTNFSKCCIMELLAWTTSYIWTMHNTHSQNAQRWWCIVMSHVAPVYLGRDLITFCTIMHNWFLQWKANAQLNIYTIKCMLYQAKCSKWFKR